MKRKQGSVAEWEAFLIAEKREQGSQHKPAVRFLFPGKEGRGPEGQRQEGGEAGKGGGQHEGPDQSNASSGKGSWHLEVLVAGQCSQ